ncbi:hypothetical protein JQK87_01160 [Streptomyces sp. G44]|uniref:hypothetical protein n=1 Tax=Streptomyces sp. G44 TaxID=2807632 RepID=UPI00195F2BC4|nr:hypothetical protein [Streptomyces sp. G44]MBM7167053.1 hypothetical protein [Streptomyces sp. G44]
MQVEPVVVIGLLDLLGCRLEELGEPLQQAIGRFQDLVGEGSGMLVGRSAVELVGEREDLAAVDVASVGIGGGGNARRGGNRGRGGTGGQVESPENKSQAVLPDVGLTVGRRARQCGVGVRSGSWTAHRAWGGVVGHCYLPVCVDEDLEVLDGVGAACGQDVDLRGAVLQDAERVDR